MKTAQESGSWSRVYDYDAYGNRWVQSANHSLTFATPTASSQFNAANNRISQNGNGQGTPPAYDAAGNLTSHLHLGAMAYDAENHQTSFTGASGTTTYHYDGDGRRVKKLQGTRTTVFVYDAIGNLAAEYDTQPAPNLMAGAYYRTTDHLGSTRLVTNATGGVVSRRDFFPFGEQIDDTWGNRQLVKDGNTTTTYNREFGVHQKFTGKERDAESALDYFGARYLSASLGRFTSIDPGNAGASRFDPQRWNGYSYVGNRPLLLVDPDGKEPKFPSVRIAFPNRSVSTEKRDAFMAAARRIPVARGSAGLSFKAGGEVEVGGNVLLGAKFGGTLGEIRAEIGSPSTVKFAQGVEASFNLGPAKAEFKVGQEATLLGGEPGAEKVEPIYKYKFEFSSRVSESDTLAVSGKVGSLGGRVGVHTQPLSEAVGLAVPALGEFFQSLLPEIQWYLEDPEDPDRVDRIQ